MNRLWLASSLLLISTTVLAKNEVFPRFDCGTYRVYGAFGQNLAGDFIFTLRKGTSSPFELLIVGGPFQEKLDHLNRMGAIEIYVPKQIKNARNTTVFLQSFVADQAMTPKTDVRLMERQACGEMKRLKNRR